MGSDRFSGYQHLAIEQRQVCWAHLKRDWTRIAERTGVSAELGKALLEQQKLLFDHWYRIRDGTLSRSDFATVGAPIQQRIHTLLVEGASYAIGKGEKTPLAKTVRTCQQLLKVETALWAFVTTEGVEPTNNAAERALRPAVLWRKNSFGLLAKNATGESSRIGSQFNPKPSPQSQVFSVTQVLDDSLGGCGHCLLG